MPSPAGTPIMLDKKRLLRYTPRSLQRMEDQTGMTITEAALRMQSLSMKAIGAVIWAGLLHEEPDLDVDAVIDRIELSRIEDILSTIDEALETSLGSKNGGPPGGDDAPKAESSAGS